MPEARYEPGQPVFIVLVARTPTWLSRYTTYRDAVMPSKMRFVVTIFNKILSLLPRKYTQGVLKLKVPFKLSSFLELLKKKARRKKK